MVVLENNYEKITCPSCQSVLGITEDDKVEKYRGIIFVECPCCGEEIDIGERKLTADDIKFPENFYYFGGNVYKEVSQDEVREFAKQAIEFFRDNKDNCGVYYTFGRHLMVMKRFPGDKEYAIYIAENYYESGIDFSEEDMWEGWDRFDE